jgi:hypothetical protein
LASNIVLGAAFGYSVEQIRPFVQTLRRYHGGPAGLLVTSLGPPELPSFLRQYDIEPIFFESAHWMAFHIQVIRYIRYWEHLRTSKAQFDRVLLTDVSDVIFQRDPFEDLPSGELLCFLEDKRMTIGTCKINSFWMRQVFGEQAVIRFFNHRISCSGTTIGSLPAILRYLELLLHHANPQILGRLQDRGHDQGIHNYMIHSGALPDAQLIENGNHVFTLHHTPSEEIRIEPEAILTANGQKPAIVHQYDRHATMLKAVQLMIANQFATA